MSLNKSFIIFSLVLIVAYAQEELDYENPFKECLYLCKMPKTTAEWVKGAASTNPIKIAHRQYKANCADMCICDTYCNTLVEAGVLMKLDMCQMECAERKPFSDQPEDWPVFFGEEVPEDM